MAISALPEKSSGLASGVLWTQQNIGGAVGLAIAGTLFRIIEKNSLLQQSAQEGLVYTEPQQDLIRSMLSNPESAKVVIN